jgi:predicted nucleic acid-binding protein
MDKGGQREKPKVVVDASVAVKWVIPGEPYEAKARTLEVKVASGEIEAHAPHLLLYEVASVILKSMLTGALKIADGIQALKALRRLGLNIQTTSWNDLAEILQIASAVKLTIYDSTYLHLSKKMNAQLITVDDELKKRGENVTEIVLLKDVDLNK